MRRWSRYVAGVVAVTGLFGLVDRTGAETCTLEMKMVGASNGAGQPGVPDDYLFRTSYPQRFFQQIGGPQGSFSRSGNAEKPEFSEVIKKEPAEYATETPFRGVAALGTAHYGFVLDTAVPMQEEAEKANGEEKTPEAEEERAEDEGGILARLAKGLVIPPTRKPRPRAKAPHFTRLYFDRNHNGDLTDDEVIEAETERSGGSATNHASFPTVRLTIDADGKEVDYAFRLSIYSRTSGTYSYASASLNAAAYRDGEITLDGVKHRVVLVDFNSNGRFDDMGGINDKIRSSNGTVYPKMGDMLYIDPQPADRYRNPYDSSGNRDQYQVNKLICLDNRFYDLKIAPAGETLSLEPSSARLGYITNPNKGFRAIIYGDQGTLEIDDDGTGKTPVPVGQWKLMSYTIERPETDEPEVDEVKKEEGPDPELRGSTRSEMVRQPRPPRRTFVSARGTRDFEAVKVVEGETVELRFGPPYLPKVEPGNVRAGMSKISLGLSLVGVGGEVCSNLRVNGQRPSAPEFTISTTDGEEVAVDKFKYG